MMIRSAISQEDKLRQMQPLILLGMHRSGTSLTARLLNDMGIYMGQHLSRDAEAVYFQKLNRRIFGTVGVKWGYVDPLIQMMKSERFIEKQTDFMLKVLFPKQGFLNWSKGIESFFGSRRWEAICQDMSIQWGWKDPRTSIAFPIWLRVFPNARLLHILRNGIDVAISVHRRSLKQRQKIYKRVYPLDYIPETLDFKYCFDLWETYVAYILEHKGLVPAENYLEIRYEDLLANPKEQLGQILDFIEFWVDRSVLAAVCEQIDRSRLKNEANAEKYQDEIPNLVSSVLMKQLDYSYPVFV